MAKKKLPTKNHRTLNSAYCVKVNDSEAPKKERGMQNRLKTKLCG